MGNGPIFVTGAGHVLPPRPSVRIEDPDPDARISARKKRRMNRIGVFAAAAALRALDDAGVAPEEYPELGICVGTGLGCTDSMDAFFAELVTGGPSTVDPARFPNGIPNSIASQVAILLRIAGPNATVSQREISGEAAVVVAAEWLRAGRARRVLVGGADEWTDNFVSYLGAIGIEGPIGEGASFVVLDREPGRARVVLESWHLGEPRVDAPSGIELRTAHTESLSTGVLRLADAVRRVGEFPGPARATVTRTASGGAVASLTVAKL